MATGLLNINPYYKGVNLDFTSKPTQLAVQLQQKEQAKAEALEKYYMDYEKSINPKGLGKGEADVFNKKYNAAREYWMKNKEAILHPTKYGMDAQSTYLAALKDAQGYIELGKQATAERKAFADYINKQRSQGKHISDNYLSVMENAMKPVEAGYVAPDLSQIEIFDPHNEKQFTTNVWGGIKIPTREVEEKEIINGKPTSKIVKNTYEVLNNDVIKNAALGAVNEYRNNRGTREHFDELFKDKGFTSQVNTEFKKRFNKDISSGADLAIGYALTQKPGGIIKTEAVDNWREKALFNDQLIRNRKDLEEGGTVEHIFDQIGGGGQAIDLGSDKKGNKYRIIQGQVVDQSGNPATITTTITGENLPKDFFDIMSKDSPGKLSGDMDYQIKAENGKIKSIKTESFGTIDRDYARSKQEKYDKKIRVSPEAGAVENVQELKGNINPKNLKKGNKYKVEGVVYTFDGKNLIP